MSGYDWLPSNGAELTDLPQPNRYLKAAGLENMTVEDIQRFSDFSSLFAVTRMFWTNVMAINGFGGMSVEWKGARLEKNVRRTFTGKWKLFGWFRTDSFGLGLL